MTWLRWLSRLRYRKQDSTKTPIQDYLNSELQAPCKSESGLPESIFLKWNVLWASIPDRPEPRLTAYPDPACWLCSLALHQDSLTKGAVLCFYPPGLWCQSRKESEIFGWSQTRIPKNTRCRSRSWSRIFYPIPTV